MNYILGGALPKGKAYLIYIDVQLLWPLVHLSILVYRYILMISWLFTQNSLYARIDLYARIEM